MKHTTKRHIYYHSSVVILLLLGLYLITMFSYDRLKQFVAIGFVAVIYALWGILHHYLEHTLTAKIVIEYVLIGSLGVVIMFFLIAV
ncbi:MAG TPA: hypothetical protein VJC10_02675 [Patescibacteria group bacterium]|nr:hypothetical protein [Patescibacteria group bacterium]